MIIEDNVMEKHRAGETSNIPFRNERYFCMNGEWFFETRGGPLGPFENKQEMEAELLLYLRAQAMSQNNIENS